MSLRRSKRLMEKMGLEIKTPERSFTSENPNVESKNWSDLPFELLREIGDRLPLLELLGFQSTCKDWRLASSTASAECEYTSNQRPCFLIYNENSQCRLYNPSSNKLYTMNLPELDGATCIASKGGWLLIFSESSVFFFCPFSHAKIELPTFPLQALSHYVAVFSSEPTARDCVVCIINLTDDILEAYVLKRGANQWDKHINDSIIESVTGAAFCNETFHFLERDKMMSFSLDKKEWNCYDIVDRSDEDLPRMPFGRTIKYFNLDMKGILGLEEDNSLSVCGTILPGNICVQNEDPIAKDTGKLCHKKGVWIHPRFFQLSPNQSWSFH